MRDKLPKQIGNRIRELRQAIGISQEQLAAQADLHRNYVGSIERGERDIGLGALSRLTKALDITLAEFFKAFR